MCYSIFYGIKVAEIIKKELKMKGFSTIMRMGRTMKNALCILLAVTMVMGGMNFYRGG